MYDADVQILGLVRCRRLLEQAQIGRVVFLDQMMFTAHPFRYVFDGDRIMFQTGDGAKVRAAHQRQIVSFEIDHIDLSNGESWSVIATGPTSVMSIPSEIENVPGVLAPPWPLTPNSCVIAIHIEGLQGRRQPESNGHPKRVATHPAIIRADALIDASRTIIRHSQATIQATEKLATDSLAKLNGNRHPR